MSIVLTCAVLGLAASHAGAAAADDDASDLLAQSSSGPLTCEIRGIRAPGSIRLGVRLTATMPLAGEARLTAVKAGSAGTSNLAQSNRFSVEADKPQALGTMQIGLEPGAHLFVKLVVHAENGLECRVAAPVEGRAE